MGDYEYITVSFHAKKDNLFIYRVFDGYSYHFRKFLIEFSNMPDVIVIVLNEFGREGWSIGTFHTKYNNFTLQRQKEPFGQGKY